MGLLAFIEFSSIWRRNSRFSVYILYFFYYFVSFYFLFVFRLLISYANLAFAKSLNTFPNA